MSKAIDKEFGFGTADQIEALSRTTFTPDKFSLDLRIKELKEKMKQLKMEIR
jgi:hypothetical protein